MAVVCLLLLLGGALTSSSPIHSEPTDLERLHMSVASRLNLASHEVGFNPLFTSVIRSLNSSCQEDVTLMNATLDVYMRTFSSLLHHKKEHFSDLKKLRDYMSKLKSQLNPLQQNKEDLISKINAIRVDDPLVQKKVLAEFLGVYHAISGLLQSRDHGYTH